MKTKMVVLVRAVISVVLMGLLLYMMRGSIPEMIRTIKRLPVYIFLFGLSLFFISLLTASLRLKILLATQKIALRFAHLVRLTFVGYFFNSFLPTAVGGDVVKAFYVSKASGKTMSSYMSVFIDRFIGMSSIFLIATAALFFTAHMPQHHLQWSLPLLVVCSLFIVLFLFDKRLAQILFSAIRPLTPHSLREKLKNMYEAIHNYRHYKYEVVMCLFISMVGQCIAFSAAYVFGIGLGADISLKSVLLAMPVASIVSMIPSINGMGPREMSIVVILSPVIGKEIALAIAFLWLGILLATALIGGLLYAMMGLYKMKPSEIVVPS